MLLARGHIGTQTMLARKYGELKPGWHSSTLARRAPDLANSPRLIRHNFLSQYSKHSF